MSGQPNLTVTLLMPLMVYLVLLWWDGQAPADRLRVWHDVAIALEFYTFIEYFAEMSLIGVAALALGFGLAGRELRPKVARLARHTAIAYLGAIVAGGAVPDLRAQNYPSTLTRQQPQFSLDLAELVLPRTTGSSA